MTGFNHALSGALIGAYMPMPVAIPAAFISHFAVDTLPHYGVEEKTKNKSLAWRGVMYTDAIAALAIAGSAAYFQKWNMEMTGWVAFSPDLVWIFYFFNQNHSFILKTRNPFMRFHRKIQNESKRGIVFELALAAIMVPLFIIELHR
jgi:hypothetical protein